MNKADIEITIKGLEEVKSECKKLKEKLDWLEEQTREILANEKE